jgi:Rod binding domain-containing protein
MATGLSLASLGSQTTAFQDQAIAGIAPSKQAGDSAKIDKSAKEFESVLVGTWLQQAEQSFGSVPTDDDTQDVGRDSMMSFGVQALATSMANSGGIGIAKMVSKALHAAADKEDIQNAEMPAGTSNGNAQSISGTARTQKNERKLLE